MVNHILNGNTLSVYVDGSTWFAYQSGIFTDCGPQYTLNHAVNIVGVNTVERYWVIRNTWGTEWGNRGYMKLAMVSTDVCVCVCVRV